MLLVCSHVRGQDEIARYPATFNGKVKPKMIWEEDGKNLLFIQLKNELQLIQLDQKFQFVKGGKVDLNKANIPLSEPVGELGYNRFLDLFYYERDKEKLIRARINKKNNSADVKPVFIPYEKNDQLLAIKKADFALYLIKVNLEKETLIIYEIKDQLSAKSYRFSFPEVKWFNQRKDVAFPVEGELAETLILNHSSLTKFYFQEDRFVLSFDFENILKTRTIFMNKKSGEVSSTDHWLGSVKSGMQYATNSLLHKNMLFQVKATEEALSLSLTNLDSRHLVKEWVWNDQEEVGYFFDRVMEERFSFRNPVFDSEIDLIDKLSNQVSIGIMTDAEDNMRIVLGGYKAFSPPNIFYDLESPVSGGSESDKFVFYASKEEFAGNEADTFYLATFYVDPVKWEHKPGYSTYFPIEKIRKFIGINYLLYEQKAQMIFTRARHWYLGYQDKSNYILRKF